MPDIEIDYEQLFHRLTSPFMIIDRQFRYVDANHAYEQAVMVPLGDLRGKALFDLFPNDGESGIALRQSFERVFETGRTDTIPFIPYDIPRPADRGGGMETRYWTAVHVPLKGAGGETDYLLQNTVDVTELARLRAATSLPFHGFTGEVQLVERAREAEEAHRSVLAESAEFRRMFQQAPQMIAVLSGEDHVFTFANDAYSRFVGQRQMIGRTARSAFPEIEGQGFLEMLDGVFLRGEEHGGEGVKVTLVQSTGGEPQDAYMDFSYRPIRDFRGAINGVFVQGMDRTEVVKTLKYQRLLLDELNHRVKNTLATVQSLASQTLRAAPDLATARRDLEGRIVALSKAHNLLSQTSWDSTTMRSLVAHELGHHEPARIEAAGSNIDLNPKASIALAMVLHELSTNAAKYGALSGDAGRVQLSWRNDEANGDLLIFWHEAGGPAVTAPSRKGFGSRMMEMVMRGELAGRIDASYPEAGFACQLAIPHDSYRRTEDVD